MSTFSFAKNSMTFWIVSVSDPMSVGLLHWILFFVEPVALTNKFESQSILVINNVWQTSLIVFSRPALRQE